MTETPIKRVAGELAVEFHAIPLQCFVTCKVADMTVSTIPVQAIGDHAFGVLIEHWVREMYRYAGKTRNIAKERPRGYYEIKSDINALREVLNAFGSDYDNISALEILDRIVTTLEAEPK